ncbi:MAG: hypothetical protein KJ556_21800 [Gammaproteobacteria bacterium]|nr:hypothetical protein [Gammaproteobacteria bacterium]
MGTLGRAVLFIQERHGPVSHQKRFRLMEPYDYKRWDEDPTQRVEYTIVSAATVPFSGPETYIFRANEKFEVEEWLEMPGSFQGELDHERALTEGGFVCINAKPVEQAPETPTEGEAT